MEISQNFVAFSEYMNFTNVNIKWAVSFLTNQTYGSSTLHKIITLCDFIVFWRPKVRITESWLCCSPTNWPFEFMFHNFSRYRVRIYTKVSKIATLLWVPMSTWQLKLTLSKGWTTILPCWPTLVFLWRFLVLSYF